MSEVDNKLIDSGDVLDDLESHIVTVIRERLGLSAAQAADISSAVADRISLVFGGQVVYITKSRTTARRNQDLFAKWTGFNQAELATEFHLSLAHVYQIIAACRSRDRASRQLDMFPESNDSHAK